MLTPQHKGSSDWRSALAAFDPVVARAPVTPLAAQLLQTRGLNAEAEAALREFLDRFPGHLQAVQSLGMLLRRIGRENEATEFLARAARIEAGRFDLAPDEHEAVGQFITAADQCTPPPAVAPAAYLTAIFDECADQFDNLLRGHLKYRAPELLLAAVSRVAGSTLRDLDILDLGCGTGLAGATFRAAARRLDGVDLSAKMLEQAAGKKIYDRLNSGDIVAHLGAIGDPYDLIIATDVFIYLGDLVPVFAAAGRVSRAGGWFAFTVEAMDGAGYHLLPVRRYAHSRDYLTRSAEATGWTVQCIEETWTRVESLQPVRSFVCVLANPEQIDANA